MSYEEKRVRVRNYGVLPADSPLLIDVESTTRTPRKLHWLAANSLRQMSAAAEDEIGEKLLVQSGWRPHRWASRADYEAKLLHKYGSITEGKKWLAFNSPHETGLAADFGSGGLWPDSSSVTKQRETKVHRWLVDNAWRYGWHPYKAEPWHWEFPVPKDQWEKLPPKKKLSTGQGVGRGLIALLLLVASAFGIKKATELELEKERTP